MGALGLVRGRRPPAVSVARRARQRPRRSWRSTRGSGLALAAVVAAGSDDQTAWLAPQPSRTAELERAEHRGEVRTQVRECPMPRNSPRCPGVRSIGFVTGVRRRWRSARGGRHPAQPPRGAGDRGIRIGEQQSRQRGPPFRSATVRPCSGNSSGQAKAFAAIGHARRVTRFQPSAEQRTRIPLGRRRSRQGTWFRSSAHLLPAGQALEHRHTPATDSGISPQWSRAGEKTFCLGVASRESCRELRARAGCDEAKRERDATDRSSMRHRSRGDRGGREMDVARGVFFRRILGVRITVPAAECPISARPCSRRIAPHGLSVIWSLFGGRPDRLRTCQTANSNRAVVT